VLVPQTVNGKPLTLKSLGELVNSPQKGHKTEFSIFSIGSYTDPPVPAPYWVLMTRDVINRDQSYDSQQALVAAYAQKSGTPYQVPNILDAAVVIFTEYVRSGTRLYSNEPLTFSRCQEKYGEISHLVIGVFKTEGLFLGPLTDNNRDKSYGMGCSRKF
jgi:hypothetical protein